MTKKALSSKSASRIHVISRNSKWAVKKEGISKAAKVYTNKNAAVKGARKLFQKDMILSCTKETALFKNGKNQNRTMDNPPDNFSNNVFINCPFDSQYDELLRPLFFTILYLGFKPRIASERLDSGEVRINKICELIKSSKYSIHDLSRIQSSKKNEIYRLNMPFELGIDIGYRLFSIGKAKNKKYLILEKEKFRYQKALSDLSNSDIKNHNNEPEDLVRQVRNWFVEIDKPRVPSGT